MSVLSRVMAHDVVARCSDGEHPSDAGLARGEGETAEARMTVHRKDVAPAGDPAEASVPWLPELADGRDDQGGHHHLDEEWHAPTRRAAYLTALRLARIASGQYLPLRWPLPSGTRAKTPQVVVAGAGDRRAPSIEWPPERS